MGSQGSVPYSRQSIDQDDIDAVLKVLKGSWLTTGPAVEAFEQDVAEFSGRQFGVSFSNGTAALHGMMHAVGIEPGDEVIVPAITFVATANAVLYQGGTPIFADVKADDLLIDPQDVERKITANTKAIVAVDYAGKPCDYSALRAIADRHGLLLLADACHSLGAEVAGQPSAALADMAVFSFHPVKPITTAEGGMVVGDDDEWAKLLKRFRGHGIDADFRQRAEKRDWRYQMVALGYNYRLSDLQAALGSSQLKKLPSWLEAKAEIAQRYRCDLARFQDFLCPLSMDDSIRHAYHLFVVQWKAGNKLQDRDWVFEQMRKQGIGVNVHYEPVYRHPFYQESVPTARAPECPVADRSIDGILSLPIFAGMTQHEYGRVLASIDHCVRASRLLRAA